ncbi:30S ribosomal protein 3-1, chloroplastic [Selaginella moellendorffii]|nr:30S ribosomal protein 3-1, chloroplastic [Selaginella moellendorffii]|eukprot:XP_002962586.2 30S ribosomal protein 3-1, chloroplastic [Selaginella moellendorffii]
MAMAWPGVGIQPCGPSQVNLGCFSTQRGSLVLSRRQRRMLSLRASASDDAAPLEENAETPKAVGDEEDSKDAQEETPEPTSSVYSDNLSKKDKLAIRSAGKQILSLRFLWMEKNIGIALDQVVPGHGTIPLSPFYFWPKKDAWEELKAKLESKPWISRRRTIILLNQATDIINLWQQKASSF